MYIKYRAMPRGVRGACGSKAPLNNCFYSYVRLYIDLPYPILSQF